MFYCEVSRQSEPIRERSFSTHLNACSTFSPKRVKMGMGDIKYLYFLCQHSLRSRKILYHRDIYHIVPISYYCSPIRSVDSHFHNLFEPDGRVAYLYICMLNYFCNL